MSDPQPQIVTGLSVSIAGMLLVAVIDEKQRTVRIEERGQVVNGEARAIDRARPDLLMQD